MPIKSNDRDKNPAAVALGKLGGSKGTDKQKQAARKNGLLGGRPKKVLEEGNNKPKS